MVVNGSRLIKEQTLGAYDTLQRQLDLEQDLGFGSVAMKSYYIAFYAVQPCHLSGLRSPRDEKLYQTGYRDYTQFPVALKPPLSQYTLTLRCQQNLIVRIISHLGLRCQRHMEGEEVAEGKRLIEGHQAHALCSCLLVRCIWVVRDNGKAQALGATGYLGTHLRPLALIDAFLHTTFHLKK